MYKPVELWFFLGSVAAGVILYLLPKTPSIVIGCIIVIFLLLIHPIWNFWWIEQSLWLRIAVLLLVASSLCFLGYFVYPKAEVRNQTEASTELPPIKQPTAGEIASEVIKRIPTQITGTGQIGNLKQRTIALSDEIMQDLHHIGYRSYQSPKWSGTTFKEKPTTEEGIQEWLKLQSGHFKFMFLDRVLALRNEYSQLHIKDQRLDNFLISEGMIGDNNKQISVETGHPRFFYHRLPQEIEEVAERLKILSEQLPGQ